MSATVDTTRGPNQTRAFGGVSLRTRVSTRLHAGKLDREIASGADPGVDAVHCERARELVGGQARKKIAASLERLLAEADSAPRGLTSRMPVARAAIRNSRENLELIVERLKDPDHIRAQGVAMISLLLSDGAGPLYGIGPSHSEELQRVTEAVVGAIETGPALPVD